MKNDVTTIESAMVDVRKAYRLLWFYHRRVYDIIELLAERMKLTHFRSRFIDKPHDQNRNPLNFPVWETLPMNEASFIFMAPGNKSDYGPKQGDYLVEFRHVADTARLEHRGTDVDPGKFDPVEQSKSVLQIYFFQCKKDLPQSHWYSDIWSPMDYPDLGIVTRWSVLAVDAYGMEYDLSRIATVEDVMQLAEDFICGVRTTCQYDIDHG